MSRRHIDVSNSADIIDSRDVIARISELEGELEDRHNNAREDWLAAIQLHKGRADADDAEAPHPDDEPEEDFEEWLKCAADNGDDDATELIALREFADEASGVADWRHGETFIRDSYFEDYAREMAEDFHGNTMREASWPFDCIDWERACDALKMDYSAYEYGDVTYWARS